MGSAAKLGFSIAGFSWDEYTKCRPVYTTSFYDRLYDYHGSKGGGWCSAHDVGAGPGVVSEELCKRFGTVIVSDPNAEYLHFAERRLRDVSGGEKFKFDLHKAEDDWLAENTIDLVVLAESIHWTDADRSVEVAARSLKKGGTLALLLYYRPRIEGNDEADAVWDDLWDLSYDKMPRDHTGSLSDQLLKRMVEFNDSGLDMLSLSEEHFERGVRRTKLNVADPAAKFPFVMSKKWVTYSPSRIGPHDIVEHVDDKDGWSYRDVDAEWFMRCFQTYAPAFVALDPQTIAPYQDRMKAALKKSNGTATAVHSASIVFATKR